LNRKSLYLLVFGICIAGILWIGFLIQRETYGHQQQVDQFTTCIFTNMTGLPCPSCGMSRSVISVFRAKFVEALWWNPLGFVMAFSMLTFPLWILTDWMRNKQSFFRFYQRVELFFRRKWIAALFIALMAALWIWNIIKFI